MDRSREGRREKINRVADASAGDGTATTAVAAATRARDGERATRTRRGRVRIAVARRRGRRDGAARRRSRPAPGIRVHGERLFSFAASSSDAHLRRREHAAAAAHVTEGTLARAVSTTAGNARNARDRAAGAPRLRRGLMAGLVEHGVRLAVVLVQAGVHGVDDVRADRREEHLRELAGGAVAVLDGHGRESGGHLERVYSGVETRALAKEGHGFRCDAEKNPLCQQSESRNGVVRFVGPKVWETS